jgi:hypothetical protein
LLDCQKKIAWGINTLTKQRRSIMQIVAALGLVSAIALAAPAFGQSFVGEWTATAKMLGGSSSEIIKVERVGNHYAITTKPVGTRPAGAPTASPGTDIVLYGDNFSYKRTLAVTGTVLEFWYTGVVSGDTFSGTAELNGARVPYKGVRIRPGN